MQTSKWDGWSCKASSYSSIGSARSVCDERPGSTVFGWLGALLGQMEMLLQNWNHLRGVRLHIGVLSVRGLTLVFGNRLLVGRYFVSREAPVEGLPLQVEQLLNGPVLA